MKSSIDQPTPINNKLEKHHHSGLNGTSGSIVLEAAMLLPLVMLVFVFFIYLVQAAVITTSLQLTASSTIKQVAAHMYPISLAADARQSAGQSGSTEGGGTSGVTSFLSKPPAQQMRLTIEQFTRQFSQSLPAPVSEWILNAGEWSGDKAESIGEQAQAAAGEVMLRPLIERYGMKGIVDLSKVRITHLRLPDVVDKQEPYAAIQVEYDLPMRVPLLFTTITLTARASERVWIGDSPASSEGGTTKASDKPAPEIISIEPDPLVPWNNAKLTAKVAPHEKAKLVVYYKSGQSVAQGLVWKTADANGYVSWEWNVSGRTTEGTWRLQVITEDNRTVDRSFNVKN